MAGFFLPVQEESPKGCSGRNLFIGAGSAGTCSAVFKPNQQPVNEKISPAPSKKQHYEAELQPMNGKISTAQSRKKCTLCLIPDRDIRTLLNK